MIIGVPMTPMLVILGKTVPQFTRLIVFHVRYRILGVRFILHKR